MATRLKKYLRAPRKLRFTREGRWFTGITVFLGFGAVNTGNNLLYLLLGMLLGLIIVSGILSEQMLKHVTIRRLPPGDLFARRTTALRYELTNAKRWFSSFSVFVQEHESRPTRAARRIALGLPAERPRKRKKREAEGDPGGPRALALRVPPRSSAVVVGEYEFPRRGLYRYDGIDLGTRFPFGFFEKIRPVHDAGELLVYPEIRSGSGGFARSDELDGEVERPTEGRGGDFFGLLEFRDGDDRRDVHWKVSARRGTLVRRLYEKNENEAVALHLFNWVPTSDDEAENRRQLEAVEEAIVAVATLSVTLSREGHRFSLHTIDEVVSEGDGAGQLQSVLRHLALLTIRSGGNAPGLRASSSSNRLLFGGLSMPPDLTARFSRTFAHAPGPPPGTALADGQATAPRSTAHPPPSAADEEQTRPEAA